jgi:hypothetical protein
VARRTAQQFPLDRLDADAAKDLRAHQASAPVLPNGRRLHNILLSRTAVQGENTFGFKLPDNSDDLLLRRLDLLDLYGAEGVHVLAHEFGATLRHTVHEVLFQFLAGAFERDGQQLTIDPRDDFLHPGRIEKKQVLENVPANHVLDLDEANAQ